jgi:DNA mismatch repair ATPase MutS
VSGLTNEEFQQLILAELQEMKAKLGELPQIKRQLADLPQIKEQLADLPQIKEQLTELPQIKEQLAELPQIKEQLADLQNKLNGISEQTAALTEFKTEVNQKLDLIIEDNKSIHEILGEHEVSIRTIKRNLLSA